MQAFQKRYTAIIFDYDGTLVDSLPAHLQSFKVLFRKHNIKINEDLLKEMVGLSRPSIQILKQLKKEYKFKESPYMLRKERRKYFFKAVKNKKLSILGAKEAVNAIAAKYKIAIATGSSMPILLNTSSKKFLSMFNAIATENNVKMGKPEPDVFLYAAKKLKVDPRKCLVLGDSILDAIGAKKAKMDFIGVLTGFTSKSILQKHGALRVISSVRNLPKTISALQKMLGN